MAGNLITWTLGLSNSSGSLCSLLYSTWGDYKHWTPEDRGPKDWGRDDLAGLYFAFMTEMQLVSMF